MECSVCLDRYTVVGPKRPVLLPRCGHTFCEICAAHLCRQSPLSACPTCRAVIGTSQDALLPNYALISVLSDMSQAHSAADARRSHKKCGRHRRQDVTAFCGWCNTVCGDDIMAHIAVTCGDFVCPSCCSTVSHSCLPFDHALRTIPRLLEALLHVRRWRISLTTICRN